MTESPQFRLFFTIIGVIWVGGGGFLMFRYLDFFAKINARLGFKWAATPKYISSLKKLGLLEMTLAAISAVAYIISVVFRLNW